MGTEDSGDGDHYEVNDAVQADWQQREFVEMLKMNMVKIVAVLNRFGTVVHGLRTAATSTAQVIVQMRPRGSACPRSTIGLARWREISSTCPLSNSPQNPTCSCWFCSGISRYCSAATKDNKHRPPRLYTLFDQYRSPPSVVATGRRSSQTTMARASGLTPASHSDTSMDSVSRSRPVFNASDISCSTTGNVNARPPTSHAGATTHRTAPPGPAHPPPSPGLLPSRTPPHLLRTTTARRAPHLEHGPTTTSPFISSTRPAAAPEPIGTSPRFHPRACRQPAGLQCTRFADDVGSCSTSAGTFPGGGGGAI